MSPLYMLPPAPPLRRPAGSPQYYLSNEQPFRHDVQANIYIEKPASLDSESQMRVYEELEKEANERQTKLKTQQVLIT